MSTIETGTRSSLSVADVIHGLIGSLVVSPFFVDLWQKVVIGCAVTVATVFCAFFAKRLLSKLFPDVTKIE